MTQLSISKLEIGLAEVQAGKPFTLEITLSDSIQEGRSEYVYFNFERLTYDGRGLKLIPIFYGYFDPSSPVGMKLTHPDKIKESSQIIVRPDATQSAQAVVFPEDLVVTVFLNESEETRLSKIIRILPLEESGKDSS